MLYKKRVFSVPASAGTATECARVGHTEPCARGKCYRCGEKVERAAGVALGDSRAIEYSRLRSAGVSVEEASAQVFGPANPLANETIVAETGVQETV